MTRGHGPRKREAEKAVGMRLMSFEMGGPWIGMRTQSLARISATGSLVKKESTPKNPTLKEIPQHVDPKSVEAIDRNRIKMSKAPKH